VLDLNMPRLDGFQVLAAMRQDESLSEVPVLVLTAKNLTADEREWLSSHVTGLLHKSSGTAVDLSRALVRVLGYLPTNGGEAGKSERERPPL
jgi:CheY-like chemotaxis protein